MRFSTACKHDLRPTRCAVVDALDRTIFVVTSPAPLAVLMPVSVRVKFVDPVTLARSPTRCGNRMRCTEDVRQVHFRRQTRLTSRN